MPDFQLKLFVSLLCQQSLLYSLSENYGEQRFMTSTQGTQTARLTRTGPRQQASRIIAFSETVSSPIGDGNHEIRIRPDRSRR